MENLKREFEEMNLIPVFEEKVIDQNGKEDYIAFYVSVEEDNLVATHVGLTKAEEESPYIAFKSIELDDCFSLDENLQALHEECIIAIINSELYTLID
tara:strand:- start:177 stop:470 length:294 start_codon:yes stop_codon:yes gene_type:complete